MAAIHLILENAGYEFGSIGCRTTKRSGETKSAVQSTGNAREKSSRQTLMVLQDDVVVREASEF
ncbi:hypothetical protein [Rhizobium sp. SL86]|jgi:hypothetical protein|uniref:hypothetical protein n=1 Tax=Rhizobium sp. SL86 TaxID=2995148 RepID=UPI0022765F41|nr:hypothetical protein [Rhizobium sp. SL86]MCY1665608.1 hypothetical protein [Rhizobium sp. SL86]